MSGRRGPASASSALHAGPAHRRRTARPAPRRWARRADGERFCWFRPWRDRYRRIHALGASPNVALGF
jgi:hypothetical protein